MGGLLICRSIISGISGITQIGYLGLFIPGLCYLYSQIFAYLSKKKERYYFQYKFFSRMFAIAAVFSCFIISPMFLPGSEGQYTLFPTMEQNQQKWLVASFLTIIGSLLFGLSFFNYKKNVEKVGQGK